ncbi:Rap guanine nucleotide exchange factor 3 [Apophysomyces ossiformis]|uniref:Rap guanine nucleotide exchange factor 3 n=1 Tax=Apophysomyces ossiformis TaxID=679940 RepID=A0A8H7BVB5_9FUNG|nr:Rap guanine nucleotide exchange factor 3 [Apophysomyces ossiformis]
MVITMGLSSRTVRKLEDTWHSLSNRDMDTYHILQRNLDVGNNMGTYRQAFHKAKAPAIPFLPIILKDLTFFMDGNQTYLPSAKKGAPTLINFAKFRSLSKFVEGIIGYCSENYSFASDLEYFPFFPNVKLIEVAPLDRVAATVEQRINATYECYQDVHCESRLLMQTLSRHAEQ